MKFSIQNVRKRLGAVGGAALLIFMTQRLGDVLSLMSGLWLVPKHASEVELGAIKPLETVAGMIGMPIAIIVTPYIKALNTHALRGEIGKVKALMRDMFIFCAVALVVMITVSALALPWILRRWGIENGRLALIIIVSASLGALVPVFMGSLQAMKQFRAYSFITLSSPLTRFLTLWFMLPFRGLSGYFTGNIAAHMMNAVIVVWRFFRDFGRKIRSESYWRDDRALFIAFVIPIAVSSAAGTFSGIAQASMLAYIPKPESAAFYILTRFTDIISYIVAPLMFVLFPTFSERHETGADSSRILRNGMFFCLALGLMFGIFMICVGPHILNLRENWRPYAEFSNLFMLLSLLTGLRFAVQCFTIRELASRRFYHIRFSVPVSTIIGLAVYALGKSPDVFTRIGLREVILIQMIGPTIMFTYANVTLALRRRRGVRI